MKRLMLVAGLCAAALAVAPVSSAGAAKGEGRCTLEGYATFSPTHLKPIPTPKLGYEFHGSAECETLPAKEILKGTIQAEGEETLSCAGSLGEGESKGTLTLGGIKFPFGLTFIPESPGFAGLAVKFKDGGVAVGSATFLESSYESPVQCFVPSGANELEFKGAAVGEL